MAGEKKKAKKIKKHLNLNELAKTIAEYEKGFSQANIADIKEILKSLGVILGEMKPQDAMALVGRIIQKGQKD
jgi:transcriptional regulator with XRE-family HTH domain